MRRRVQLVSLALLTRLAVLVLSLQARGVMFVRAQRAPADSTMSERPADTLYDDIAADGVSLGRNPEMHAFGTTLGASDIRALVGYIRALCKCAGPTWSREPSR